MLRQREENLDKMVSRFLTSTCRFLLSDDERCHTLNLVRLTSFLGVL